MEHKFEIFSAGCTLCKRAIEILKDEVPDKYEIVEYNIQSPIKEEIQEKITNYKINAVPSIIIDEKYKVTRIPKPEEISKIIAGF
jgi:glutaredoxin